MDKEKYAKLEQGITPKPPLLKNVIKAFLVGGTICLIAQFIALFYMTYFDFTERTANNPTVATMIFLSMLLTGFGVYKKIGQFGGAGGAVPITGFGNAVVSAAIEHRSEGFVLGVGGNIFKLAGSVILFGVFSAFLVALIKTILVKMGGRFMVGKGLLKFANTPSILSTGVTAGPLERKSAFLAGFDKIYDDERCGMKTNEQGHSKLMEDACMIALSKIDKIPSDADFLMAGDLVNQMTPTNFFATAVGIPYIGMFSACATSVSSLLLAATLTEAGMSKLAIAGSSSQHNAIERQFRYPIEYGTQKGDTSQWTVTAAGAAAVAPFQQGLPSIECGTIGKAVDMGMTDPLNMGAAMAPAAADTLKRHLEGHGTSASDYDLIMTGDLATVGFSIFKELAKNQGITDFENFSDAGMEFYGNNPDFKAGASGAGCSAAVYFSDVYQKMRDKEYQRVLLIATGALLSPLSYQQGETIPCIAHAVELTMK